MILLQMATLALGGTATLHVAVHQEAGTVYDIAADSANGQCAVAPGRVSCPASRAVTFRWGPETDRWELTGQTRVEPGEVGVAFVLAPEDARAEARERLRSEVVEPATVTELFLGLDQAADPPSYGMVQDLVALTGHARFDVRRAVIDALVPWWRHTASDPFEPEAPPILPDGVITRLARDENWRIRRRMANRLREVRSGALAEEALLALLDLTHDKPQIQRAAVRSLGIEAQAGLAPAEIAWDRAMRQVSEPGPPGRAAANTLGHLAHSLEPSALIDPREGVRRTLRHHTERGWNVWSAWRHHVPFERAWADLLLRDTVGLSTGLVRHWSQEAPEELAATLAAWEPLPPHSERFEQLRGVLGEAANPALRAALGLPPLAH